MLGAEDEGGGSDSGSDSDSGDGETFAASAAVRRRHAAAPDACGLLRQCALDIVF